MDYDHSHGSSSVGLVLEGSQSVEEGSQTLLERQLKHLIGAEFSAHPLQYRRILSAAEVDGYRTELITEDGVVNICLLDRVILRVRIAPDNLVPGGWEDKLAVVCAQVRLMRLIEEQPSLQSSIESGTLELEEPLLLELKNILGLPNQTEIEVKSLTFPGARQLQLLHDGNVVASLIYNPILRLVLEFRIDPLAILDVDGGYEARTFINTLTNDSLIQLIKRSEEEFAALGIDQHAINKIREEINLVGEDSQIGILKLVSNPEIRVLAMGESHLGFGDPNRRSALRLMRKLQQNGITHFAIPLPQEENPRLQQALNQRDVRRYWLERAAQRAEITVSSEWTVMLQRAHDIGLNVTAVGSCHPDHMCQMVKRIERTLSSGAQNRVLLWLENHYLARNAQQRPSVGTLLKQQFGIRQVATVATLSHQLPDAPLKILTEGPGVIESLKRPVLIRMAEAPLLRRLPWSIGSAHRYEAWDYILLYPGSESRFQSN